jgi:hypothetical protein
MSTPGPGRKLSTADLATPAARTDTGEGPEGQPAGPVVAGPEARRVATEDEEVSALFADDECQALWKRWDDIQAGFVDEPRQAVQDADSLVAETMQQLANTFARERGNLEQQWGRGDNVSTEDLRIAFRRYRSFFKRLLSV